jgi:tetratricopeptide (TPR) repeat protein
LERATVFYLSGVSLIIVLCLIKNASIDGSSISTIDIISISIGLIGLIFALWSIRSTTISLNDIQSDYWNVRGLDEGRQRNYHNAIQSFDKAARIDPRSIKCLINKANVLREKGKTYCDELSLIEAFRAAQQAINQGPKWPPTWKNETPEESKALQEYSNALKTKCDILLDHANIYKNAMYREDLRIQALKVSEEAIDESSRLNSTLPSELPGAYTSRGNALCSIGKYDEAIEFCNKAIMQAPYEAVAWGIRGNTFNDKGNFLKAKEKYIEAANAYTEAISDYDRAIELKPNTADFWYNRGNALLNKSNTLFKTIADPKKISNEENCETYNGVLYCYNEAIHSYDKAIEFDPLDLNSWRNKGDALFEHACYNDAIKSYDMAIDINPLDAATRKKRSDAINARDKLATDENNEGIALLNIYMYGEALNFFEKVIQLNPKHAGAFNNKGIALHNLGKYDDAIRAYDKAIEINPKHSEAWENKGIILLKLRRHGDALFAFDMVNKLKPEFTDAWHNKGIALEKLGQIEEAILAYDQTTKLKPDFTLAWYNKGLNLGNLRRNEEALFAFDRVTKLNPKFADAWYNKGIALEKLGKIEEAILAYDQATNLRPDFAEVWYYKGIALKLLDRFQESDASFAKAKKLGYRANPSSVPPRSS